MSRLEWDCNQHRHHNGRCVSLPFHNRQLTIIKSIPSYKGGSLLNQAMAYLGHRSARELIKECENDPATIRKLCAFFKGVAIKVLHRSNEVAIDDIVPHAGEQIFNRDGEITTVKVWDTMILSTTCHGQEY